MNAAIWRDQTDWETKQHLMQSWKRESQEPNTFNVSGMGKRKAEVRLDQRMRRMLSEMIWSNGHGWLTPKKT